MASAVSASISVWACSEKRTRAAQSARFPPFSCFGLEFLFFARDQAHSRSLGFLSRDEYVLHPVWPGKKECAIEDTKLFSLEIEGIGRRDVEQSKRAGMRQFETLALMDG